jgi:hypothetical protein
MLEQDESIHLFGRPVPRSPHPMGRRTSSIKSLFFGSQSALQEETVRVCRRQRALRDLSLLVTGFCGDKDARPEAALAKLSGVTFDQAWGAAVRLVNEEQHSITSVAEALLLRRRLDERQFLVIM